MTGFQCFSQVRIVPAAFPGGTFLYMNTLHELRHTPLIENCCTRKGFIMIICGFIITALVRLLLGEAHHM